MATQGNSPEALPQRVEPAGDPPRHVLVSDLKGGRGASYFVPLEGEEYGAWVRVDTDRLGRVTSARADYPATRRGRVAISFIKGPDVQVNTVIEPPYLHDGADSSFYGPEQSARELAGYLGDRVLAIVRGATQDPDCQLTTLTREEVVDGASLQAKIAEA